MPASTSNLPTSMFWYLFASPLSPFCWENATVAVHKISATAKANRFLISTLFISLFLSNYLFIPLGQCARSLPLNTPKFDRVIITTGKQQFAVRRELHVL